MDMRARADPRSEKGKPKKCIRHERGKRKVKTITRKEKGKEEWRDILLVFVNVHYKGIFSMMTWHLYRHF